MLRISLILLCFPLSTLAGPVFPANSVWEKVWSEGEFTEGPTEGPDGCIYFSDIGNRILKYDPDSNKTIVFRDPSGRSNGLKFDLQGQLIACEGANTGGNRRISITDKSGKIITLANQYNGKRFNSPNDLIITRSGDLYFTDPRYVGNEPRELPYEGIYHVTVSGKVSLFTEKIKKPNGIALSPDQKTLYVAETNPEPENYRRLLAIPILENGQAGDIKIIHDFKTDRGIDGLCVTTNGWIVTTAGRDKTASIMVFDSDGKIIDQLATPEDPANCCFAGKEKNVLYLTAGKSLYRVKTTAQGIDSRK